MPRAFIGVMVRLNNDTAQRMVKTCLTFAADNCEHASIETRLSCYIPATVMLRGPTLPLAEKLTTFSPNARLPFRSRIRACVDVIPPSKGMPFADKQLCEDVELKA